MNISHYNISDDAIADAKDVSFDILFQHYDIRYTTSKGYSMIDYICPFHEHSTNTYHASKWYPDRKYCMCYACNEKLDTIDFVSKMENIPFREAVVRVLEIAGIDNKYIKDGKRQDKKPFQLRYLTKKEKIALGFSVSNNTPKVTISNNKTIYNVGVKKFTYDKPKNGEPYIYDYDTDAYVILDTVSESEMWKDLMKNDPLFYRTMILEKVSEVLNEIHYYMSKNPPDYVVEALNERKKIVEKVAEDFGYYRVVNYLKQNNI